MRRTIDEIKLELSKTPKTDSFRLISKQEQQYYWGAQHPFISILPTKIQSTLKSKAVGRKKKLAKLSPLLFPTSFPNN